MFKFHSAVGVMRALIVSALVWPICMSSAQAEKFARIGRAATPSEIAAWDIDVRPDFQGLPRGSGSVAQGEKIWVARCASCHGEFAESPSVFPPLVGGRYRARSRRWIGSGE